MSRFTEDKVQFWIILALLAALFAFAAHQVAKGEEELIKGEKINCWTLIEERDGQAFTIDTSTMTVEGRDGTIWQAQTGTQSDGGEVWALIDTTAEAFEAGTAGYAEFEYHIGGEIYIFRVPIRIRE
jgi:hypothetical protein